ncbi:MAG: hypothetical protein Q9187_003558 [Circinaria calcarea]
MEDLPELPVEPDVMNDPTYETNTKGKGKSVGEPDTCRICRGEGSKEEPLFYPCKCSGSIKFVHQSCLMEWLSHSQKKYCELCKTSFRFTKLYHPQMPETVPLPVFLHQAMAHTIKSLMTWTRWQLVILVWLGWVPWCMRTVWRGLFWIGDGGWVSWEEIEEKNSLLAGRKQLSLLSPPGSAPLGHEGLLSKAAVPPDIFSKVTYSFTPLWPPFSQTFNFTAGEPKLFRFAKRIIQGLMHYNSVDLRTGGSLLSNDTATPGSSQRSPSWLSDLGFLRSLTPWTFFNNLIIDILEGQLITLSVCVVFILIFLIREWVVQQQPGINMGVAANAAAERNRQAERQIQVLREMRLREDQQQIANHAIPPVDLDDGPGNQQAPEALMDQESPATALSNGQLGVQTLEHQTNGGQIGDLNTNRAFAAEVGSNDSISGTFNVSDHGSMYSPSEPESPNTNQRPSMPTKITLARATEIRRTLEEQPGALKRDWPGLDVFMDLWKRADSNPVEVLRIIQEEDREEELSWVVSAMKRLESAATEDSDAGNTMYPKAPVTELEEGPSNDPHIDASNESWKEVGGSIDRSQLERFADEQETLLSGTTPEENYILKPEGITRSTSIVRTEEEPAPTHGSVYGKGASSNLDLGDLPSPRNESNSRDDLGSSSNGRRQQQSTTGLRMERGGRAIKPEDPEVGSTDSAIQDIDTTANSDVSVQALPPGDSAAETLNPPDPPNATNPPQDVGENIVEWLWGGVPEAAEQTEEPGDDDEQVVENVANEAPFVPVANGQLMIEDDHDAHNVPQDPEIAGAAGEAGLNPNNAEVVEDGEDLEGIMELIGMQGPLAGLVQNGMFSAVLISMTVFFGIWVPYIAGKLVLVLLANPVSLLIKFPLRWASTIADMFIDTCVFVAACAFYWVDRLMHLSCVPIGWVVPFIAKLNQDKLLAETARSYAQNALERLAKLFIASGDRISDSDIPVFSIIAHESLRSIEQRITQIARAVMDLVVGLTSEDFDITLACSHTLNTVMTGFKDVADAFASTIKQAMALTPSILRVNPLRISLDIPHRQHPLDYSLAQWNTKDRAIAIALGYLSFCVGGAVYLKIKAAFRENRNGDKPEGAVADIIIQAGGVMKVILIISIEMIVFPLYCGVLLDVALLPLFENATALSRLQFTIHSLATSLFVHWFVGTCYMFHFALFVAMCRKIMRSGVLYFIRDPDDPTFHPVRDVLERNVTTQLRKIAFSALVYGALVIVCLGSVVWGLSYAFEGIFPIHWSSNEPVLEFPVDLLFYNFLMPLAVKFFRPSKGLSKLYSWWFRKCARMLRLTEFLFGERKEDEEGHYVNPSWWSLPVGLEGSHEISGSNSNQETITAGKGIEAQFVRDGQYVRAPSSDQVRIPKGKRTFVEVDEDGKRMDGLPEEEDEHELHGRQNKMFSKVYIPPYFRFRIFSFILFIWLFAAITGVGMTIIPLVFGRYVFAHLIPNHLRMNDIYAFSIGFYLLGGPLYLIFRYRSTLGNLVRSLHSSTLPLNSSLAVSPTNILRHLFTYSLYSLRLVYFYTSFSLLLPSLFTFIMELYLIIPLHTYFSSSPSNNTTERHTIHFIQDWTLGVLYIKMASRIILWHSNSRPARALRALVAPPHGWLDPDVRLATRAFIFPATTLMLLALSAPLGLGWIVNLTLLTHDGDLGRMIVYRYSYPAVLATGLGIMFGIRTGKAVKKWRLRVRDEVYLIGERLHNFGERRGRVGGGSRMRTG